MTEEERTYIRRLQKTADHVIICWQLERDAVSFDRAMDSFIDDLCSVVHEVNIGTELYSRRK